LQVAVPKQVWKSVHVGCPAQVAAAPAQVVVPGQVGVPGHDALA
jgi:hypothetical protein